MCELCTYKEMNTFIPVPPTMMGWTIESDQYHKMKFISPCGSYWIESEFFEADGQYEEYYIVETNIDRFPDASKFIGDNGRKDMQEFITLLVNMIDPYEIDIPVLDDLPKGWVQEFEELPEEIIYKYTNGIHSILVSRKGTVTYMDYVTEDILDENRLFDSETVNKQVKFYMIASNSAVILHPDEIMGYEDIEAPEEFEVSELTFPGLEFTNGVEKIHIMPDGRSCVLDSDRRTIEVLEADSLNHIKENINVLKERIKNNYYQSNEFKEKSKLYKTWLATIDEKTCQYCRAMNGKSISEWAKFWFDIGGKQYGLNSPPLHWVFNKEGRKIITCRCHLEFSKEKPELADEPSRPDKGVKEVPK